MKNIIVILCILISIQINLSAQNNANKNELSKVKKQIERQDLKGFSEDIKNLLSNTSKQNINQQLLLIDNIYSIVDGEFNEACDTAIDVYRRNYLVDLLKYLSNKKDSKFEAAYINFMIGNLKYSVQKQVATSNFEANINAILPQLNPKEKEYVLSIKTQILQKVN